MPINTFIPTNLRGIKDLVACADCEEPEYKIMVKALDTDFNSVFILNYNAYVPGADDSACKQWEKALSIIPNDTDTLSDRQFRIWSKLFNSLPYTKIKLTQVMDTIMGQGNYTLVNDVVNKKITLSLFLGVKSKVDDVRDMLEVMLPANIQYIVDILYNTYEKLSKFTYERLSLYTYDELRQKQLD